MSEDVSKARWLAAFGLLCHQYRVERGWSQEEVARHVGVNLLSYANTERGKSEPRARMFVRIVTVLGIPFERIPSGGVSVDEKRSWLDEPVDSEWGKNVGERLAFIASRVSWTTPSPELKDLSKALLRLLDERAALLAVLEAAEQGEDKDIFRHDDQCDAVWLQENGRFGICTCGLGALYDAIAKARAAVSGGKDA